MESKIVYAIDIGDLFHSQVEIDIFQFFLPVRVRDPGSGKHDLPKSICKIFAHISVY